MAVGFVVELHAPKKIPGPKLPLAPQSTPVFADWVFTELANQVKVQSFREGPDRWEWCPCRRRKGTQTQTCIWGGHLVGTVARVGVQF